jgi:hypothetical protein
LIHKQKTLTKRRQHFAQMRLTVCVTGAGAGVDSVWEQKKLEAREILENAADSPASSARFVGWRFVETIIFVAEIV